MVVVEKTHGVHFKNVEAVIALDFQPHPAGPQWPPVERLAAAAGSCIKLWTIGRRPPVASDKVGDVEAVKPSSSPPLTSLGGSGRGAASLSASNGGGIPAAGYNDGHPAKKQKLATGVSPAVRSYGNPSCSDSDLGGAVSDGISGLSPALPSGSMSYSTDQRDSGVQLASSASAGVDVAMCEPTNHDAATQRARLGAASLAAAAIASETATSKEGGLSSTPPLRSHSRTSPEDKKESNPPSTSASPIAPLPPIKNNAEDCPTAAGSMNFHPSRSCRLVGQCVATLTEHSPHYIVGLRWSPSGRYLGSCDNRQVIISEFSGYITSSSTSSPSSSFESRQPTALTSVVESRACQRATIGASNPGSDVDSKRLADKPLPPSATGIKGKKDSSSPGNTASPDRQEVDRKDSDVLGKDDRTSSSDGANGDDNLSPVEGESWRCVSKLTDGRTELFDLAWIGDDRIVTGGVDGIKIWRLDTQQVEQHVNYAHGFVKGVACHSKRFIAAQSNDRRAMVWVKRRKAPSFASAAPPLAAGEERRESEEFALMIESQKFLARGPSDLPYNRRCSFDPAGKLVAFPYGERGAQCFGFSYRLDLPNQPAACGTGTDFEDLENGDNRAFRFRGHQARVNAVAFSRGVWREIHLNSKTFKDAAAITQDENATICSPAATEVKATGGLFTLYAQASLDGALSIWRVMYPAKTAPNPADPQQEEGSDQTNGQSEDGPQQPMEKEDNGPSAICILVLQRFLDEQGSVTDLAWSSDGVSLAVGSDDGSITFLLFKDEELFGEPFPNPRFWSRLQPPSPPRPPLISLTPHPPPAASYSSPPQPNPFLPPTAMFTSNTSEIQTTSTSSSLVPRCPPQLLPEESPEGNEPFEESNINKSLQTSIGGSVAAAQPTPNALLSSLAAPNAALSSGLPLSSVAPKTGGPKRRVTPTFISSLSSQPAGIPPNVQTALRPADAQPISALSCKSQSTVLCRPTVSTRPPSLIGQPQAPPTQQQYSRRPQQIPGGDERREGHTVYEGQAHVEADFEASTQGPKRKGLSDDNVIDVESPDSG